MNFDAIFTVSFKNKWHVMVRILPTSPN